MSKGSGEDLSSDPKNNIFTPQSPNRVKSQPWWHVPTTLKWGSEWVRERETAL